MKDKAAVGANLYIDDSVSQVKALRQAGKKAILYITLQNREANLDPPRAENWKEVERLVLEEVKLWEKERLAKGPLRIAGQ